MHRYFIAHPGYLPSGRSDGTHAIALDAPETLSLPAVTL
jgi:hypothetical protein